jgi:hypothetical protein
VLDYACWHKDWLKYGHAASARGSCGQSAFAAYPQSPCSLRYSTVKLTTPRPSRPDRTATPHTNKTDKKNSALQGNVCRCRGLFLEYWNGLRPCLKPFSAPLKPQSRCAKSVPDMLKPCKQSANYMQIKCKHIAIVSIKRFTITHCKRIMLYILRRKQYERKT